MKMSCVRSAIFDLTEEKNWYIAVIIISLTCFHFYSIGYVLLKKQKLQKNSSEYNELLMKSNKMNCNDLANKHYICIHLLLCTHLLFYFMHNVKHLFEQQHQNMCVEKQNETPKLQFDFFSHECVCKWKSWTTCAISVS